MVILIRSLVFNFFFPIYHSSSFPLPFAPLQRRGCLVAPLFLWIVLVPCAGGLVQRQGWSVKGLIWPSEQAISHRANSWLDYQRPLEMYEIGERGEMRNFVYSSPWDFKSSFTFRKILRHGTFPLYFPFERKVCCGFWSLLRNPSPWPGFGRATFGSSGHHTIHYTTKATKFIIHVSYFHSTLCNLSYWKMVVK
jgi:hypothetical protein